MLDAYIIEEIKRQEEARQREEDAARPRVRIERELPPAPPPLIAPEHSDEAGEDAPADPIRIDISGNDLDGVAVPIRPPRVARRS